MTRKRFVKEVKEYRTQITCDFCEKNISGEFRPKRCPICNKDLCSNCGYMTYNWLEDEIILYCSYCHEVGKKYIEEFDKEEDRHNRELELIQAKWVKEATKNSE